MDTYHAAFWSSNPSRFSSSKEEDEIPYTLGDQFTFQQDNNLKHKAKYTLELLTKTTLNVP